MRVIGCTVVGRHFSWACRLADIDFDVDYNAAGSDGRQQLDDFMWCSNQFNYYDTDGAARG